MNIGTVTIHSKLALAPMAGVTDLAFRTICRELGAGYTVTEMVSAKALCYQDKKSLPLLELGEGEHPCAAQVFGSDEVCMEQAAAIAGGVSRAVIIDINTPEKLEGLDGQVFLDETEDTYCVWRAEYSKRSRICSYFMDLFRLDQETGLWERGEELHQERSYEPEELVEYLREAGFQDIRQYGNRKMRPPKPGEDRIFFTARKDPRMTTQV